MWSFVSRARTRMTRSSLRSLMSLDARQLNDLGLTHHDVMDAMRDATSAADLLSARRQQRATSWLR